MTATTALTAQNTQGVQDVHHTPPAFLKKQLDAVLDDVGADVVKTGTFFTKHRSADLTLSSGMLASAETIEIVADALRKYNVALSVVDPVRKPFPRRRLTHKIFFTCTDACNRSWYQLQALICSQSLQFRL